MSNVENEGLRTLDQVRARRAAPQYATGKRLNPGELEEIEAAAQRGAMTAPHEVLALVNTVTALSRRIAVRFNETAEARQDAVAARERAERAEAAHRERVVELTGMVDLGKSADAVALRERAERAEREVRRLSRHVKDTDQLAQDVAASAARERELTRKALEEAEQARTSLKDARVQIAGLRAERGALYTREQVAQLQTSEAELVSAPLKRRIGELERVREETGRQAIELEDNLKAARGRIEELEAQGNRAVAAVNERDQALETVAGLVYAEEVTGALTFEEHHPHQKDQADLVRVVRGVRAAMPAWLNGREREGRSGA